MTGVDKDLATLRDWIGDPEDYSDEDRGAAERACDACDGVEAELSRLREQRDAYRNAESWMTTCLNCSRLLDSCYSETIRAEAAEARCARLQQALRPFIPTGKPRIEYIGRFTCVIVRVNLSEYEAACEALAGLGKHSPIIEPDLPTMDTPDEP